MIPSVRYGCRGFAAVLALCGAAAAEPLPRSGVYDSMTLAVEGEAVSGVFVEERGGAGGGASFSCIFLLRGRLSGLRAEVETWFPGEPERIRGNLAFTPEGAALTLAEDHGGCPMTTGSMTAKPYTLLREADEPAQGWRGVALVTARRARFRPEPGPAPERGAYLVRHDPVAILERRDGWVRALYRRGAKPITGWLPEADLALAAAP
ncbi:MULTISPECIES: hypothetical protein [Methylorubrum]|uniref:hypothetical protein n=1 Tax=Methylorubrum TaxID=2282523 RepID=UPI0020A0A72E|nr:hypothetical protein [Methylorubrum zatmanii]MCP1556107.1 hypothetical protein [Methylorubrum extorquens]MCP1577580.1 hypothetical protein [Methylorubrum extorquens]